MLGIKNYKNWQEQILDAPADYEGKFIVFSEKQIFFTHENAFIASDWLDEHRPKIDVPISLYLVPHHFGQIRLL